MKFRTERDDDKEREENPAFKQVPELWDFLNHEDSWNKFQQLIRQKDRQGVPYYCLSQSKKVGGTDYARLMCHGDKWERFDDFIGFGCSSDVHSGCVLPTVVVCNKCLKAIGVDPSQYDDQDDLDYRLRNEEDPDKLIMMSIGNDLHESEWKILYFRWYELMIKAGRWTEEWDDYVRTEGFATNMADRARNKYMRAGNTDPDMFVRTALGWYKGNKSSKGRSAFRKWSQEWHDDRNRVTAGRMIERMYWLLGEREPPRWEQVKSMKACVETVEKMRSQGKEYEIRYRLLDSKTWQSKSNIGEDVFDWALQRSRLLSRAALEESYACLLEKRYRRDPRGYWESVLMDRERGVFVPRREQRKKVEND